MRMAQPLRRVSWMLVGAACGYLAGAVGYSIANGMYRAEHDAYFHIREIGIWVCYLSMPGWSKLVSIGAATGASAALLLSSRSTSSDALLQSASQSRRTLAKRLVLLAILLAWLGIQVDHYRGEIRKLKSQPPTAYLDLLRRLVPLTSRSQQAGPVCPPATVHSTGVE